jgi:hypothetical protein
MSIKACYSRGTTTVYPWSENAEALNDDKLMETTEEWLLLLRDCTYIKDMNAW